MSSSLTRIALFFSPGLMLYHVGIKQDERGSDAGPQCAYRGSEASPHTGANVSAAPVLGMIGRRVATLAVLAVAAPATIQAQVGLASGGAQIALIARAVPGASISGVSPARETARQGSMIESSAKVRLTANTAYRLVVVGTAPVSSAASRLWVRAENGRFEELRSGAAVTVARGHHADAGSEPEVSFRSEASASGGRTDALPVRYEIRVEPTI